MIIRAFLAITFTFRRPARRWKYLRAADDFSN
jgi:hypothetical protein